MKISATFPCYHRAVNRHNMNQGAFDVSLICSQTFFEFLFMDFSIQIILLHCNNYSERQIP